MSEVTNIPQKSVVRQSTKPTAPQAGLLWYDTSADVLKQFKNGSFQTVGNSIDNQTIGKNQNGEIQVIKSVKQIGLFESSLGNWVSFNNPDFIDQRATNGGAEGSNAYARIRTDTNGKLAGIKQSFDLTNFEKLEFYYKGDPANFNASADGLVIKIGNETVFSKSGLGNQSQWFRVVTEVSEFSGTKDVKLLNKNNSGTVCDVGYDIVSLINENGDTKKSIDSGAGN